MHAISVILTLLLTGTPAQYDLLVHGYIAAPTAAQVRLITELDWLGLGVVALIGVVWLVYEWRTAPRWRAPSTAWRVRTARA
jgi:hypothetical protein